MSSELAELAIRIRCQMSHLEAPEADAATGIRNRLAIAVRSRHLRHPTPFTRSHPHALTRGIRLLAVFTPPPLVDPHVVGFGRPCQVACIHLAFLGRSGGRGGGALVERGVHPDLDIALEGSRDQAVLFGFMSGLVERGLIGTRNHTVDVELA